MNRKCPYCKMKIKENNHLTRCIKKYNIKSDYKIVRYDYIKYNFPQLTQNRVEKLYINESYSLTDFKKKFDISFREIQFLLGYYNLPKRGISEGLKKSGIPKAKKTNLKKYGAENVLSKGTEPYKKRNETVKEKYGVDNVFQCPEIIDKIRISNNNGGHKKRMDLMENLYGYRSPFQVKKIHSKALLNSGKRITKLNKKIYEILDDNCIKYEKEFFITDGGNNYFYDIKIENTLIEINGDYWHANPNKYDKNWLNKQRNMTAKEIWDYDNNKIKIAVNNGFDVYVMWENEIRKSGDNIIYENIKNKIN